MKGGEGKSPNIFLGPTLVLKEAKAPGNWISVVDRAKGQPKGAYRKREIILANGNWKDERLLVGRGKQQRKLGKKALDGRDILLPIWPNGKKKRVEWKFGAGDQMKLRLQPYSFGNLIPCPFHLLLLLPLANPIRHQPGNSSHSSPSSSFLCYFPKLLVDLLPKGPLISLGQYRRKFGWPRGTEMSRCRRCCCVGCADGQRKLAKRRRRKEGRGTRQLRMDGRRKTGCGKRRNERRQKGQAFSPNCCSCFFFSFWLMVIKSKGKKKKHQLKGEINPMGYFSQSVPFFVYCFVVNVEGNDDKIAKKEKMNGNRK
jgi:hypothetical protein